MNKIIKLAVFLAVVAALAGGSLSFVNGITEPIITANNLAAERASLIEMYPEADVTDFEEVDNPVDSNTITKIYKYNNFYIFNCSVSGYKDGTVFLVSIDKDSLQIDKYVALSNGDTKGLGSKVTEPEFKNSLEGNDATGTLDTISGATVSSSAVVEGIHEAADVVSSLE